MSSSQLTIVWLTCFLSSLIGQTPSTTPTDATRIRALAKAAPRLPLELSELKLQPPREIGFVSSVASDRRGNFYLLQRDLKSDPIIVIDKTGKVLRSWGKGLFTIPHSIRLDPSGNVWTTDANTSMVLQVLPGWTEIARNQRRRPTLLGHQRISRNHRHCLCLQRPRLHFRWIRQRPNPGI